MSESYVLHDVMRKVKADGLFDSIRRDLISDIEQKPSYLDLKTQIESSMSTYLSEHKWSTSLKKTDIRERARRHIETSNLIKDTLPSLVNQYMQTCQPQSVQPRLLSFVSDHIEHVYNTIGGTHVYRPTTSYTQSIPTPQESLKTEMKSVPTKNEAIPSKPKVSSNKNPQTPTASKNPMLPTKKPLPISKDPNREEKKTRILSPTQSSPNELIDISPLSLSIDNERTTMSSSPSPPPPVVRIAPPLSRSSNTETPPRKIKRLSSNNDQDSTINIKKKKIKTDDRPQRNMSDEKADEVRPSSSTSEADTRKLRQRRPNPKYSNEQFETDDLNILDPSSPSSPPSSPPSSSTISKTKKFRHSKSSTSFDQEQFDTPSSPPPSTSAPIETSLSLGDMSPEYGTSLPSRAIENPPTDFNDEQSRTPSPVTTRTKKTTSPRRLRPRKAHERFSTVENQNEKTIDLPMRTSSKTRESSRHRTEQFNVASTSDDIDLEPIPMKKTRHPSSSGGDNSSNELPSRSISVPDNLNTTTEEISTTRLSPSPSAPVSKSFIWKPKISK